jgi:hypothetical protein
MHQLHRDGLHTIQDVDQFFDAYLGQEVRRKLEAPLVQFSAWPDVSRQALRALCTYFAERMPEGDHVVRADVGERGKTPHAVQGELLFYVGYQLGAPRRQYIGIAHSQGRDAVVLALYIAGATDGANLESRVAAEDPLKRVDGQVITSTADINRLLRVAEPVLSTQRTAIAQEKGGAATPGFCPSFCQRRWNVESRKSDEEARQELWEYITRRRQEASPDQFQRERALLKENNQYRYGRAVAYVRDLLAVEAAYTLALSEHA